MEPKKVDKKVIVPPKKLETTTKSTQISAVTVKTQVKEVVGTKVFSSKVSSLRDGKFTPVFNYCQQILLDPEYKNKDNMYNIMATDLKGQMYYYTGNITMAKNLFRDGLSRDVDLNIFTDKNKEKDFDLAVTIYEDKIKFYANQDYLDIKSFWNSPFGYMFNSTSEEELIDKKTKDTANESLSYLNVLNSATNGIKRDTPGWLQDLTGNTKKSSKTENNFYLKTVDLFGALPGIKVDLGASFIDIGSSKDVSFVLIPLVSVSSNTNGLIETYTDPNAKEYILEPSIIEDLFKNNSIDSNTYAFLMNKWTYLPDYLKNNRGKDYKILSVGPMLTKFNFGIGYVFPFSSVSKGNAPTWPAGSLDANLGYERKNIPLTYFNYDKVRENGLDSYNSVKGDFDPEEVPFSFSTDKLSWSANFNFANIITLFNKSDNFCLNLPSLSYDGSVLWRSDADIYTAMGRIQQNCMTETKDTMQKSADAIWNNPLNHQDPLDTTTWYNPDGSRDLASLWDEPRWKYESFINRRDTLNNSLKDIQADLNTKDKGPLSSHTIGLKWTWVMYNILQSRLKLSLVNFKYILSDNISMTGGGLYPAIDPVTLQPLSPEKYLTWLPEASISPTFNLFDQDFMVPLRLAAEVPTKGGWGIAGSAGINYNNMLYAIFNISHSENGKGYKNTTLGFETRLIIDSLFENNK